MDVDTGSDDAVAMIAALLSPELEVMGIATVNGNRREEYTTENTLRIVDLLESSVPVYRGCQLPVCSTLLGRRPGIPKREDHSVTLIPLGPITNLANAIAVEPRIVSKIKEIICMAGGFKINNRTAAAEYNVWIAPALAVMKEGVAASIPTKEMVEEFFAARGIDR